jgi:hypothetical protein
MYRHTPESLFIIPCFVSRGFRHEITFFQNNVSTSPLGNNKKVPRSENSTLRIILLRMFYSIFVWCADSLVKLYEGTETQLLVFHYILLALSHPRFKMLLCFSCISRCASRGKQQLM